MARLKTYLLGAATLVWALAIGYVMQYGFAAPAASSGVATASMTVSDITLTSSAVTTPRLPAEIAVEPELPDSKVELTAAETESAVAELPADATPSGFDCAITMEAMPAAAAMVDLRISAPCNASERLTLHHHGLMFTEIMQPDGTLRINVPAMAERATFIAAFNNGEGATATVDVSSLTFYDRVAVQWAGEAGLQLHAREFESEYFSNGHIWAASAGEIATAARGEGGFLTRLGRTDTPEARIAEVYSFPSGTAKSGGDILLSVEAEITEFNCDKPVEAQSLELRDMESLRIRELSLEMPSCDSVGDFLVLKNLIEDLKIASR